MQFQHVYVLPPRYFVWPYSPHIHRTEFVTSHNEQKESFQQYFYNRYKIVVYTGLRSDSIKNRASHNEARRIAGMRINFTRIGCTLLTCDMCMSDLRHIHDPVLSSLTHILLMWRIRWAPNNASKWRMGFNSAFKGLKMESIRFFFSDKP
jgi:hypothetical protein